MLSFESVDEAYQSATKRVSTSMLRRIMDMAQSDHQPPMVSGRRVKFKYAGRSSQDKLATTHQLSLFTVIRYINYLRHTNVT